MKKRSIPYNTLVQNALRNVVRDILKDISKNGPIGDHYFYLAFDTSHKGVSISPKLKSQFPEEMTIVLQHQFWDLEVLDDHFKVLLSFGNVPESLTIPYNALVGFYDPSVDFAIDFGRAGKQAKQKPDVEVVSNNVPKSNAQSTDSTSANGKTKIPKPYVIVANKKKATNTKSKPKLETVEDVDTETEAEEAKVISLDAFRNKKK